MSILEVKSPANGNQGGFAGGQILDKDAFEGCQNSCQESACKSSFNLLSLTSGVMPPVEPCMVLMLLTEWTNPTP